MEISREGKNISIKTSLPQEDEEELFLMIKISIRLLCFFAFLSILGYINNNIIY
jgi:hypothetical protein